MPIRAWKPMKHKNNLANADAFFKRAQMLHEAGQLKEAAAIYKQLLSLLPQHPQLLTGLGMVALQQGNLEEGVRLLGMSLTLVPNQFLAVAHRAAGLEALGRLDEALQSYDRVIALDPSCADTFYNRGNIFGKLNRFDDAVASYSRAIELNPADADSYTNRGNALMELNRLDEALASYERALVLNPGYAQAYNNRGVVLHKLGRLDEALASYDRALALNPEHAEACSNRGNVLQDLNRLDEALAGYERALALKPDHAEAHYNRGNVLQDLNRPDEALASYDRALALKPDYAEACNNRGNALQALNRLDEALASYDRALAIRPDYAEAYGNRGNALRELSRLDEAHTSYERSVALNPDRDFILGDRLHTKMHLCDWSDFHALCRQLIDGIENRKNVAVPFVALALMDRPEIHKISSEMYVKAKYPSSSALPPIAQYPHHDRIRIGYFSADFHNHATMHLMAEMFEHHDKNKFEIIAFSFGPDIQDAWRKRVVPAFDQFMDVRFQSDRDVALLARSLEIDIAVDLKGITATSRTGIFAERAAPIQVNYLGYPGTMGPDYIDYLIADATLIPEDKQQYYSEKIAYLPDSYQVNVARRDISDKIITRAEVGLPNEGFVFCCFNNSFKITPDTFDGWMRILKQVAGSVLWLYQSNDAALENLRREAELRGIDGKRLVSAPNLPVEEHLNRIRLADLLLDTVPYNAHTTTSDALRMGLPVLTLQGESFASRVAASLLHAVGLPELITTTQAEYEALAIVLASNPGQLTKIKSRLVDNLPTSPLYDSKLFCRHIESAFTQMYQRYRHGLEADHIQVASGSGG